MELFIESSKTDQSRQGAVVVIARTGTNLCQVAMLERYVAMASVPPGKSDSLLFRGITKNVQAEFEFLTVSSSVFHILILGLCFPSVCMTRVEISFLRADIQT